MATAVDPSGTYTAPKLILAAFGRKDTARLG